MFASAVPLAGERNIIAGNNSTGVTSNASTTGLSPTVTVLAVPSGMIVRNNYIGVAVDGTTARGNGGGGVGRQRRERDHRRQRDLRQQHVERHFHRSALQQLEVSLPAPADLGQVYTTGSNAVVTGNLRRHQRGRHLRASE
jgi:hypothetical protein